MQLKLLFNAYYITLRLDAELFIPFFLRDPVGLSPLCTHRSQALMKAFCSASCANSWDYHLHSGDGEQRQKKINATVFKYLPILGSYLEHTCVSFPGNLLFLQVGRDLRHLQEAGTCGLGAWELFCAPRFRGGCSCRSQVRGDVLLQCWVGSLAFSEGWGLNPIFSR